MKKGIIVALILMSIGFAAVTTSLVINGTINYGYDSDEFDVYFSEAILDGEVKSEELIDTTKKSITFTTKELSKQGDRSILEYQVMNNSKQYDASVTIECERVDESGNTAQSQESEYTTITPSPASLTVKAQESRKGTITVELKKVSLNNIEEKFKCSLTVNPSEREEEGEKYIAENSCENVAAPNLGIDGKLIPITLSDDGKATVVSEDEPNWYDYCNKKWANAVILNDGVDSQKYPVGSQIEDTDIESYFVWIPKYKYRLWNVHVTDPLYTVHSIEIEFDTKDTEDLEGVSCKTPMNENNTQGLSGDIGKCGNGEYMTHPAFISLGVDGFWVGKFETGYNEASDTTSAQQDNNNPNNIIIKPCVYSWRNVNVKNMFEASKKYDENLRSHMMKNTEWGAVAYLSHSIFGINNEITINNNSAYKTGYAALPTTDQSKNPGDSGDGPKYNTPWNTKDGHRASTTGNITGIYDMNGGNWEYMASYVLEFGDDASTFSKEELSEQDASFFDVYDKSSTIISYGNMILGDATGEMGPINDHKSWYGDGSDFADTSRPWFGRGGPRQLGSLSGLFYFTRHTGVNNSGMGFRIVLSPSK